MSEIVAMMTMKWSVGEEVGDESVTRITTTTASGTTRTSSGCEQADSAILSARTRSGLFGQVVQFAAKSMTDTIAVIYLLLLIWSSVMMQWFNAWLVMLAVMGVISEMTLVQAVVGFEMIRTSSAILILYAIAVAEALTLLIPIIRMTRNI
jgi:hypothetical protein